MRRYALYRVPVLVKGMFHSCNEVSKQWTLNWIEWLMELERWSVTQRPTARRNEHLFTSGQCCTSSSSSSSSCTTVCFPPQESCDGHWALRRRPELHLCRLTAVLARPGWTTPRTTPCRLLRRSLMEHSCTGLQRGWGAGRRVQSRRVDEGRRAEDARAAFSPNTTFISLLCWYAWASWTRCSFPPDAGEAARSFTTTCLTFPLEVLLCVVFPSRESKTCDAGMETFLYTG